MYQYYQHKIMANTHIMKFFILVKNSLVLKQPLKGFLTLLFCNFFWAGSVYGQSFEQFSSEIITHQQSGNLEYGDRTPFSPINDGFNIFGRSGNALFAPPSGGDPISGIAPVGNGVWVLIFLAIAYGLFRSFCLRKEVTLKFNFKATEMKKYITLGIFVLCGMTVQISAQNYASGKLLYNQDFGGDSPTDDIVSKTGLPVEVTTCTFVSVKTADNQYNLAKYIPDGTAQAPGTDIHYPAWFYGQAINITTGTAGIDDHTYPGDYTRGYMMIINAAATPQKFYTTTIDNLCPDTKLYFSAWAANLVRGGSTYGSYVDPKLRFVIQDMDGDTLAQISTAAIPKTTAYRWNQYGIEFLNTDYTSIVVSIFNDAVGTTGNDLALDDIQVWLSLPQVVVTDMTDYCANQNTDLTVNISNYDNNFTDGGYVQWQHSPTGADGTWTNIGDQLSLSPSIDYTSSIERGYYYRVLVGTKINLDNNCEDCLMISNTVHISQVMPATFYWKKNPVDQNWNNPNNWELVDGTPVAFAPTKCTDVHIPGYSSLYPSLEIAISGPASACHDIWFHFGGAVGKPHLLDYDKAYVQYNFGYNNGINGDPYSATPMNRNQWYALAAPLQKMTSGDFSVGGYPNMWQQSFETSPQAEGTLNGKWYTPVNTNNWDIENQYNAISIWAGNNVDAPDNSQYGEGPAYQTNLDGLKGIFEMPFFENPDVMQYHRGFSHSGGTSSLLYYYDDRPNLDLIEPSVKSAGTIERGDEAYRFIFEGPNFTKNGNVYSMDVTTGQEIMVGNPFISNLDFDAFALDNNLDSYRLYVDNNFSAYSYTAGSGGNMQYIAPLQAFFITPADSTLSFNADVVSLADPYNNKLRSSGSDNTRADVLYLNAESSAGNSWLTLSMQQVNEKNLSLLLPDGYPNIPQLYATDATGQRNSIQFEGGYVKEIPVGVLSDAKENVTITIHNKEKLSVNSLILRDNYLKQDIDLLKNDSYPFLNVPGSPDRFSLIVEENKATTGISDISGDERDHINMYTDNGVVYVSNSAGKPIQAVEIIGLQGQKLVSKTNFNQSNVSVQAPENQMIVIIRALSEDRYKVEKVIMK